MDVRREGQGLQHPARDEADGMVTTPHLIVGQEMYSQLSKKGPFDLPILNSSSGHYDNMWYREALGTWWMHRPDWHVTVRTVHLLTSLRIEGPAFARVV